MKFAGKRSVLFSAVLILAILSVAPGCVLSQLIYVLRGHKTKADYAGLAEKKVAVICRSDAEAYGPDTLTSTVSKTVGLKLQSSIKKIQVVPQAQIDNWIDQNNWNQKDFVRFGKGVGAQMVVDIEVGGYTIHEGRTLYKGRSVVRVTVYDVENDGTVVFEHGPSDYVFPSNGRPALQTNDRNFEAIYLAKLTEHISNFFCDHDQLDQFADDASMMH